MSFDVEPLLTNVPLEETINIIIRRIFDKNGINTKIPKQEIKELLYFCTKLHASSCIAKHICKLMAQPWCRHWPFFLLIFLW